MYNFQIKGKIKIMGLFTGNFYSKNLRMTTQINVIFPDVSNDVTPLYEGTPKVLYLLHGLSGNSDDWTRFSKIEYYAKNAYSINLGRRFFIMFLYIIRIENIIFSINFIEKLYLISNKLVTKN